VQQDLAAHTTNEGRSIGGSHPLVLVILRFAIVGLFIIISNQPIDSSSLSLISLLSRRVITTTLLSLALLCFHRHTAIVMNDPRVTTKEITKEGRSVMKNLEPRFTSVYADAGVFCPALKVNIHSSSTVLVKDACGNVRVSRVLDIVSHDKVIVNWCPMMDYGHFKRSPLSDESLRANVELYQGEASDEVSTSCISDVAYVFSQEYITDNNVDLSCIQNAYIIRFRLTNDNQTLDDLPHGHFKHFPSMYSLHKNRFCLHRELWNSGKVLRRSLTSALNRKEPGHAAGPLGVSYAREPMSSLYWKHLCNQVGGSVTRTHDNKRQVKMIKVHPHFKLEANHDPRPVDSLLFRTTSEINCLRPSVGNTIGFGMHYVPFLEEKY
jgi:hypothetical protein